MSAYPWMTDELPPWVDWTVGNRMVCVSRQRWNGMRYVAVFPLSWWCE